MELSRAARHVHRLRDVAGQRVVRRADDELERHRGGTSGRDEVVRLGVAARARCCQRCVDARDVHGAAVCARQQLARGADDAARVHERGPRVAHERRECADHAGRLHEERQLRVVGQGAGAGFNAQRVCAGRREGAELHGHAERDGLLRRHVIACRIDLACQPGRRRTRERRRALEAADGRRGARPVECRSGRDPAEGGRVIARDLDPVRHRLHDGASIATDARSVTPARSRSDGSPGSGGRAAWRRAGASPGPRRPPDSVAHAVSPTTSDADAERPRSARRGSTGDVHACVTPGPRTGPRGRVGRPGVRLSCSD